MLARGILPYASAACNLLCLQFLLCAATGVPGCAQEVQVAPVPSSHPLIMNGLGKGTEDLGGLWQFQLGDDQHWALPTIDDSHWESILADSPWGAQGHPSYTGIAWYRRHLEIHPASGAAQQYRVLIPDAEDAYEVYWNGQLIGRDGRFPPHASWDYSVFPHSFPLTGATTGVLAIRVWKAPLDIFSIAESGGLNGPPIVGDSEAISLYERAITWNNVQQDLFDYSLILLRVFIAALCVILWIRNKMEPLLLWVGVFTLTPVALGVLQNLLFIPFSYEAARFVNQPLYALSNVSLWFLLVFLLKLDENRRIVRWTKTLAWLTIGAGLADGVLALFWGSATMWMQWADGVLAASILVAELFPFVLIALGLQRRLDPSRWVVAVAAFVSQLLQTCADASALGRRFTHWTLYDKLIDYHQLQIGGVVFRPQKISSISLFVAIIYAVYRYILEQQARRTALEQEMQSAREIQQVLIPETLPLVEGYAITSAYTPAQEVGGDFFQIISDPDGSTFVAVGDVSGKGLKAAMNVAMILGAMRAQAACTSSPAAILSAINECLVGRMHGGFATGVVLRLDSDGTVTFANAGHLPPFLNGQELLLEPALPLGLSGSLEYSEATVRLHLGDQLSFYTDGLLEARSTSGELYGFDRLHRLFATRPTAQQVSEAAVAFGQDDDITVLILTRLAEGEEATTLLVAPPSR